ncbi:NAD(P)/FAD-dependent oxidoreductase [Actinomadura rudentiformis]|uniref:FAD-binding oxidoreductase n=1 Tax=Actinomadura rudentiformis TaxID=359158 RepID=A0A6H9YIV3_9ACTN|nr:FAD-binding oxidoreductase [Actinomadura rudentiformis]KAB2339682.1 FAD-binding oxidoreductase [Actinomadura rudentiformis]
MTGPAGADLAVVGGGVIGAFVVHEALRRHPDWRVLLLERSAIGAGATAWSAGVSFPLAATARHRELVLAGRERYAALRERAAGPFLRPVQMIYVLRESGLRAFGERVVGTALRPATPGERQRVAGMMPDLRLEADEVVVTHDGEGLVVAARPISEALIIEAAGRTEVQLGQRVEGIEAAGDGYRLRTDHAEWNARRVVTACGAWTPPVDGLPEAPGARRKRIAALHARLPVSLDDPLVYFVDDDLFLVPLTAGVALVSFYRDQWDTDPEACDGRPNADDLRQGRAALGRRSPMAAAAVTGGRAFCDLYTDHRLPVVTTSPEHPGLAAIRGGSGSGVRLAPGLAAEALDAFDRPGMTAVREPVPH